MFNNLEPGLFLNSDFEADFPMNESQPQNPEFLGRL